MGKKFKRPFARLRGRWLAVAGLLLPVLLLASCQVSPSFLRPASEQASRVADLTWQMFALAAIVFVVVESLLIYAVFRFRRRLEGEEPRQVFGHTRLEIAWTAAPGVVLIGVLYLTFQTMAYLLAVPADSLQIKVTAHQWWWEIEYPQDGIVTANEIHVPVGRPVKVDVVSADVIHSYFAPELGGRIDALPDHVNTTWFEADNEGTYRGFCAEFCGAQHANMGFLVVANPTYDAWVQSEKQPAAQPAAGPAQQGQQAFVRTCGGCHTVTGTQAQGKIGPNLTHVGSRQLIAANTLNNTPEDMARWITDPQSVKPGNLMRVPPLQPDVVQQLVVYLEGLK